MSDLTPQQRWKDANRDRVRAYQREWYRLNSEKVIKNNLDYAKRNRSSVTAYQRKRKLKLKEGGWTQQQWEDLVTEWNNCCAYCGAEGKVEADHCVPLSRGGKHDISNIIPSCRTCNQQKYNRYVGEWLSQTKWNI